MLIKASLFCLDAVGLFNFIQRFKKFTANVLGLCVVGGAQNCQYTTKVDARENVQLTTSPAIEPNACWWLCFCHSLCSLSVFGFGKTTRLRSAAVGFFEPNSCFAKQIFANKDISRLSSSVIKSKLYLANNALCMSYR